MYFISSQLIRNCDSIVTVASLRLATHCEFLRRASMHVQLVAVFIYHMISVNTINSARIKIQDPLHKVREASAQQLQSLCLDA